MPLVIKELETAAERIKNGVMPDPVTVREFLPWFRAERRGPVIVRNIRRTMDQAELTTDPDFEFTYIDNKVSLVPAGSTSSSVESQIDDPTHRIDLLESAHRKPIFVAPDSALSAATTLMLTRDYSQLPVMTGPRDVKGIISWKTISSRLSLGMPSDEVRNCMDTAQLIDIDASLFSAIDIIAEHSYVLVVAGDKSISGIVTASDLSQQFRQLAEPFMLTGEIENHVRIMIHGKFTSQELEEAQHPNDADQSVEGSSDLTLGAYVQLLSNPERWEKVGLAIDRRQFIEELDQVREIRNTVMHFDPEGLSASELATLQSFAGFLRNLRKMGAV